MICVIYPYLYNESKEEIFSDSETANVVRGQRNFYLFHKNMLLQLMTDLSELLVLFYPYFELQYIYDSIRWNLFCLKYFHNFRWAMVFSS